MYKPHFLKTTLFGALVSVLATNVSNTLAADLTDANEIVAKANLTAYYAGDDGRSEARMLIKDSQGRVQKRQFTILRRDREDGGKQDFLVVFSRPSDVRNTAFLVAKTPGKDDDRWLYLPGLDLVKRISAGDKRTSFVGSHFFYEDVSGRGIEEDTHQLIETGGSFYQIKSTPIKAAEVEFSGYSSWINKQNYLPEKIEYLDDNGQLYRRIEVIKSDVIQGNITVIQSKAMDLRSGAETIMEFRYQKYDLGMEQAVFSERSLRKPPRQWLRRQ
ncbi:outer membrane lipoprotein-sorting protein [Neptuniibacter sp. QD72_48]|uniref:outer membrane lipoprotein-sorting protein n=1 Tax=Neptuniibacter sp. QD72_48 TaxID=3398214 RepID=UPI0039F47C81